MGENRDSYRKFKRERGPGRSAPYKYVFHDWILNVCDSDQSAG